MEGAEEPKNQEAQIYTEARSYVVVEIVLEKPLVSKRPPEQLAAKVNRLGLIRHFMNRVVKTSQKNLSKNKFRLNYF